MGRERRRKSKIIYGILAALVFVALAGVTFPRGQRKIQRTEYPVVILGDSLLGLCRDETSVSEILSRRLGREVFNGAFGGTCMAVQNQHTGDIYTTELLSMVSLSKAVAADDFGVQQTVRGRREVMDYFMDTVDELECVDFRKVEILILEFGINDYHAGIPLENEQDPFDETTYAGALRSVIHTLRKSNPDMRIILATPTYSWYPSHKLTCEEYVTGDVFLEAYVEKEKDVGEEMDVEVIDLYHGMYEHEVWDDWKTYTIDGLHPNLDAREWIAGRLEAAILDR